MAVGRTTRICTVAFCGLRGVRVALLTLANAAVKITLRDKVYKALLKDKLTAEQRRMRDAMRAAVWQAKREGRMGMARKKKLLAEAQKLPQ